MHITKSQSSPLPAKVLWLSDLHIDRATDEQQSRLADKLAALAYDAAVITGDSSSGPALVRHLSMLADACAPRRLLLVLGNHDFYNGSFREVREAVARICRTTRNLTHLGMGDVVALNANTAVIGHDGWADARAGWGSRTIIESRDHHYIEDFQNLTKEELFSRMESLGRESAAAFRATLPRALKRYRHVVVATHVPPFPSAAHFSGKICDATFQPHFSNISAGLALIGITKKFPRNFVTVLAGHTHSPVHAKILPNLEIRVAGAQTGKPAIQDILQFASSP